MTLLRVQVIVKGLRYVCRVMVPDMFIGHIGAATIDGKKNCYEQENLSVSYPSLGRLSAAMKSFWTMLLHFSLCLR